MAEEALSKEALSKEAVSKEAVSAERKKIVINIPRRKLSDDVPTQIPPASPAPSFELVSNIKCAVCEAKLAFSSPSENPLRVELLLTKTGAGDFSFLMRACCLQHTEELFSVISCKAVCPVCGKVAFKGKRQRPAESMYLFQGHVGQADVAVWYCSEACTKIFESKSCAPKFCWSCNERQFYTAEAINFAKHQRNSPQEAATQAASRVKIIRPCSGCHVGAYCSERCQKDDWPKHKQKCKALSQASPLVKHLAGFGPKICPQVFWLL